MINVIFDQNPNKNIILFHRRFDYDTFIQREIHISIQLCVVKVNEIMFRVQSSKKEEINSIVPSHISMRLSVEFCEETYIWTTAILFLYWYGEIPLAWIHHCSSAFTLKYFSHCFWYLNHYTHIRYIYITVVTYRNLGLVYITIDRLAGSCLLHRSPSFKFWHVSMIIMTPSGRRWQLFPSSVDPCVNLVFHDKLMLTWTQK